MKRAITPSSSDGQSPYKSANNGVGSDENALVNSEQAEDESSRNGDGGTALNAPSAINPVIRKKQNEEINKRVTTVYMIRLVLKQLATPALEEKLLSHLLVSMRA